MKRLACLLCVSLVAASPVWAQLKASNAPIEVSADSFIADMNTKSGTYSGNVLVKQGEIQMRANSIRVNIVDGKPDKILASGKVVVQSPTGTVSGDSGVYDVAPRLITMTGNVELASKGKFKQYASVVTYNLNTGTAKFGGPVTATPGQPAKPGTRVHGTFTPPPASNPKPNP